MDIIKEIEKISKQVDLITEFIGEFKEMFNIADLQSELERAKTLVLKSKNAISGLKSTVLAHEATIANQASQIATHIETIAQSVETSNAVTTVTSSFHNVLSDLESFLTSEVSANVAAVPDTQTAILTPVQTPVIANTVVAETPVVSPAAVSVDEVTAEIQTLHDQIIGTNTTPVAVVNTSSIPIQTVDEIDALYHRLEAGMQHNSDPIIDPRLNAENLMNAIHLKLGTN